MSDFQVCRLKGGYRIHRKLAGEKKAICGAEPHEVVRRNRNMRSRAGWWIYKDSFDPVPANPLFDFRCKICFAPPARTRV